LVFLILREEHRLRVLKRIFGPKTEEEEAGVQNGELRNLYASQNIIMRAIKSRRIRWEGMQHAW